ncbi:MAG: MFS transporter [Ginsengibacter sp.]
MQGLKENRKQFWLLVLVNAFVGSMVGLERSVIPGFAEDKFHINGNAALMSFIIAFGVSKALSNLLTGHLTKTIARKHILIMGWVAAIPVPFLMIYSQTWGWIIVANLLLGINQGLAWSSTVIMKIDLVGNEHRGFAMGINEFSGYLFVGLSAYLTAAIAAHYGFTYLLFLPGIFISIAALLISIFFVKDTKAFAKHEAAHSKIPLLKSIWKDTSFKHPNLGSVTLSGLVNNMNDGVVWGLLPVFLLSKGYTITQIGMAAGVYPLIWGLGQLISGKLGDHYCKKQLINGGMFIQAVSLIFLAISKYYYMDLTAMILLGAGTALVYPNFITIIAENSHPNQRTQSLSIFRFWRDSGYVFGALLSGFLADRMGIMNTLMFIGFLTALSGIIGEIRMCCTKKILWRSVKSSSNATLE